LQTGAGNPIHMCKTTLFCTIENAFYFTEDKIFWERKGNKLEVLPTVFDVLLLASKHLSVSA
jgi:hypothetical protein